MRRVRALVRRGLFRLSLGEQPLVDLLVGGDVSGDAVAGAGDFGVFEDLGAFQFFRDVPGKADLLAIPGKHGDSLNPFNSNTVGVGGRPEPLCTIRRMKSRPSDSGSPSFQRKKNPLRRSRSWRIFPWRENRVRVGKPLIIRGFEAI